MKKLISRIIICLVLIAGVLNVSASIGTAWYRFESGTSGANIGTVANSGSYAGVSAAGRAFHTDGTQPKYSNVVGGPLVEDGLGGTQYSNAGSDFVGTTTADTGDPHGGGVIDVQGLNFYNYYTSTVEFFWLTPSNIADSRSKRILFVCGLNNDYRDFTLEIRHESDDSLFMVQAGQDVKLQGSWTGPLTADTWYHLAVVVIDTGGDGNFPTESIGDDEGTPVYYAEGKTYFFVNHELALYGDTNSQGAYSGGNRAWFGGFPPGNSWDDPTTGRLDATAIGNYDEIRFTIGWIGGTHLDAAALHPDDFLRMVHPEGTLLVIQ